MHVVVGHQSHGSGGERFGVAGHGAVEDVNVRIEIGADQQRHPVAGLEGEICRHRLVDSVANQFDGVVHTGFRRTLGSPGDLRTRLRAREAGKPDDNERHQASVHCELLHGINLSAATLDGLAGSAGNEVSRAAHSIMHLDGRILQSFTGSPENARSPPRTPHPGPTSGANPPAAGRQSTGVRVLPPCWLSRAASGRCRE